MGFQLFPAHQNFPSQLSEFFLVEAKRNKTYYTHCNFWGFFERGVEGPRMYQIVPEISFLFMNAI